VSLRAASNAPDEFACAVTCADVHPVLCRAILRGDTIDDVINVATRHGASAHGFTPAYYDSAQRIKMLTTLQENCASD
jgi:hypothetical protein